MGTDFFFGLDPLRDRFQNFGRGLTARARLGFFLGRQQHLLRRRGL
jgi:hypothetical protein